MGKFPEADAELIKILVCRKCKTRNKKDLKKCRKCGSIFLRPKRREIRAKKQRQNKNALKKIRLLI